MIYPETEGESVQQPVQRAASVKQLKPTHARTMTSPVADAGSSHEAQ